MAYCALYMCIKTYHLNHAGSCIYTNSICIVGEKNDWYHTNYQLPKQLYIQPVTVDPLLKNCYTIHYISNCVQLCIVLLIKMCSLVKIFVGGGREKHLWWYNKLAHWQLLGIHNNTYKNWMGLDISSQNTRVITMRLQYILVPISVENYIKITK